MIACIKRLLSIDLDIYCCIQTLNLYKCQARENREKCLVTTSIILMKMIQQ